ncbi:PaaI family thioesterase [Nocardia sp. NBC_00881]|uniref:PaaI family thioesterase n=1 Tax=Nocardia sp. NBC_00881 TaxID=2975995 RepID=UPI00386AB066|nr:PaaI family thioesterase [Nocardia sp. NBC_00881]
METVDEQQERRRRWFREHWERNVAFNAFAGLVIDQWDDMAVAMRLPYRKELSAHDGIFHGGVVAAVIDTCASGAVMAGHDFVKGSRLTTISLSVQYFSVAPGEDLRAVGTCLRRGRSVHFAEARIYGWESGKLVASGQVAVNIAGERPGLEPITATDSSAGSRFR